MEDSPDATNGSAKAAFLAGLRLERLYPDSVRVFMRGLPPRVGDAMARLTSDDGSDDEADGDGFDEGTVEQIAERLHAITDELDKLCDRVAGLNYSLDPDADVADMNVPSGVADGHRAVLGRIEAGATEVARRLAGLPNDAWSEENLLEEAQRVIGEISWQLNRLTAEIDALTEAS